MMTKCLDRLRIQQDRRDISSLVVLNDLTGLKLGRLLPQTTNEDPDCAKLKALGVTKSDFTRMVNQYKGMDARGLETGSIWVDSNLNGGLEHIPFRPGWTASGSPSMSPFYNANGTVKRWPGMRAISHMHPNGYFPFGNMFKSRRGTNPGAPSDADANIAAVLGLPNYFVGLA